jgi:ribonuclease VapC
MTTVSSVVLDVSALLALPNEEPGASTVGAALAVGASISSVNLSEGISKLAEIGASEPEMRESMGFLDLEVLELDEALAYRAGMMRPITRDFGLSLGDRCCLAHGAQLGLPVLTADRSWLDLAIGVDVRTMR